MVLRIAVVTDIHYGIDVGVKKGTEAPRLIEDFIDAADQFKADYILNLGDSVSSQDPASDTKFRTALRAQFKRAACPVLEIDGNHDVRYQARQSPSGRIITHDHHIILWNPYLNRYTREGVIPDPQDIEWLENEINSAQKPVILLSHIPFAGPESKRKKLKAESVQALYYPSFFEKPRKIKAIVESSGKVLLCLSGHRHLNYTEHSNGTHHVIQQSMVETVENGQPSGAYSMIEVDAHEIRIKGFGLQQPALTVLPLKPAGSSQNTPPAPSVPKSA